MYNTLTMNEKNSYSEVLQVLKNMSKKDYEKVPKEMIDMFEEYSNKDCEFVYDIEKKFEEQNLSKDAKLILAILFRDYWATPEQRNIIIAKQKFDRMQMEKEKQTKYKTEDLFKNKVINKEEIAIENVSMIEYKESFIKKIINKIKSIFLR